jgi:hypothetical protein
MKVIGGNLKVLEPYGFKICDQDWKEGHGVLGDYCTLDFHEGYVYEIGHSRRGQFYYILVDTSGNLTLYASEPDGSGSSVNFPDIIIQLILDDIVGV